MKQYGPLFFLLVSFFSSSAQVDETDNDSSQVLQEVVVKAYEDNRKLIEVPAAISVISKSQLNRFGNTSLLPAMNTNPGIRMEERSPGSYRLNIRGSSLRSPFGVRNVKVYYNDIPYTDPGGNSFLNQVGFYNVQSVEVIKGPGSSLYGAGTGGVVLIKSELKNWKPGVSLDYLSGSFNTNILNANLRIGQTDFNNTVNYQYQKSDGYREHTKMERKVFTWDATARINAKGVLQTHFLYGDLFYETPGALNLSEYKANPKSARPGAGPTPGAIAAHAAIYQKMYLAGFTFTEKFNEHWQNSISLYGAYSQLKNPTTRNYERRTEPHAGGRNLLQFRTQLKQAILTIHAGAEVQQGFSSVRVSKNNQGNPDSLQTDDEINNRQFFVFSQAALELPGNWFITAGASLNKLHVQFTRLSDVPSAIQIKNYNNELAPRLAVLKKLSSAVSLYGTIAKGFSPPTNAELLPSTGVISTQLEAEHGINYEVGARGSLLKGKFYFDINAFFFRLKNTIAQRRDISGADYFVNAGATKQQGIETFLTYQLAKDDHQVISNAKLWLSHTWHDFHYNNFQKITNDTTDLSGKQLPSIPPQFIAAGLDITSKFGLYTNITYDYSDRIALNDANTDFSSSYHLLTARIGFRKTWQSFQFDVYSTVDNIFNARYSLGNDINAIGGRYYNAAPGINYVAGVSLRFMMQ